MKKILVASLCIVFIFSACAKSEKNKQKDPINKFYSSSMDVIQNDVQIDGVFLVTNEMKNKDIKVYAYDTTQSKDGVHYFQLELENNGAEPITLRADQIVLVDSYGNEKQAGLIDSELISLIEPNGLAKGLVAFEEAQHLIPAYLKLKKY